MDTATQKPASPEPDIAKAISDSFANMAAADVLRFALIDVNTGPTPEQTDSIIDGFDRAVRARGTAVDDEKEAKKLLTTLIRIFGHPAPGSEHSHTIRGALHSAMMTNVTSVSLDEEKIATLCTFLNENDLHAIFGRLFSTRIKHELVAGAEQVLITADMAAWKRAKVKAMFGECIKVTDSAPRVKVELLAKEPKQPRKRAARKAVQA